MAILKALERARFGRRSEALDEDQHQFVFDEIRTGLGSIEARLEAADPTRNRTPRARKSLPTRLERVEEVLEPTAGPCACGSHHRVKTGEDVGERLDVSPARFRVDREAASPLCLHGLPGEHCPGGRSGPPDRSLDGRAHGASVGQRRR
jgi:hypothetical protein